MGGTGQCGVHFRAERRPAEERETSPPCAFAPTESTRYLQKLEGANLIKLLFSGLHLDEVWMFVFHFSAFRLNKDTESHESPHTSTSEPPVIADNPGLLSLPCSISEARILDLPLTSLQTSLFAYFCLLRKCLRVYFLSFLL